MSQRAKSLSAQIRTSIKECGASRYTLARTIGVAQSVLSRFMSGKQGLALGTLDLLAEVLGLQLVVTIQQVPRPHKRGRRAVPKNTPKESEMPTTKNHTPISDNQLAFELAKSAKEDHFSSRRGVWYIEDRNVLAYYNNNPYERHPSLREAEHSEFRAWCAEEGIRVLAEECYPPLGQEEAGYTTVMLLEAEEKVMSPVCEKMHEILLKSIARTTPEAPSTVG